MIYKKKLIVICNAMSDAHLETIWAEIEPSLNVILGDDNNSSLDVIMYTNTYTKVYDYCITSSTQANHLKMTANFDGNNLVGGKLYDKIKGFLQNYLISGKQLSDESFLDYYIRTWQRFLIGSKRLDDVMDYLNRHWISKERYSGHKDVYDIFSLCLLSWRDYKFQPNLDILMDEIMNQIRMNRLGNNSNLAIKNLNIAIRSFVLLGFDTNDLKKQNLSVYINDFEKRFLTETHNFYVSESKNYIQENGVINYIHKALRRIDEEILNLEDLNDHTRKPLNEVLNKVLIEDHQDKIRNELATLLDQERYSDLKKMNVLLNRVPSTLPPLLENFQNYIINQALEEIKTFKTNHDLEFKSLMASYESEIQQNPKAKLRKPQDIIDPNQFVKTLLKIYNKFKLIVEQSFNNNFAFIKALDSASQSFINKNIISVPTLRAKSKTPEYLAKYCDDYLKLKNDNMSLDEIIVIFNFLDDKESFEIWYRRCLSKRLLLTNLSPEDEEREETIIQRLKTVNSVEYTNKITNMFNDIRSSKKLSNNYKELINNKANSKDYIYDLEPKILDTTSWQSLIKDSNESFILPNDLILTEELFSKLYKDKQNGRKLNWIWNRSKIELKANLSKPGKPPFTFILTLYQYAILSNFQDVDEVTTAELLNSTALQPEIFKSHMIPFLKNKLITQTPPGEKNLLNLTTKFKIVKEYTSKKLKVNFATVKIVDSKTEEKETNDEIDAHKTELLKAAIVRILKARKSLKHESLVLEIHQIMNSRFKPTVTEMKKAIALLIDEQYIARTEDGLGYDYLS